MYIINDDENIAEFNALIFIDWTFSMVFGHKIDVLHVVTISLYIYNA